MMWDQIRTFIATNPFFPATAALVGAMIAIVGSYLVYRNGSPFYLVTGSGLLLAGLAQRLK